MKKLLFMHMLSLVDNFTFSQIERKWKTIDDKIGQAKSIVEIYKKSSGKYYENSAISPKTSNNKLCKMY